MKCTNKWRIVLPVVAVALLFCGCSKDDTTLENAYDVFDTSTKYGITKTGNLQSAEFSTTKILTALIALEESNLDDVVTVSANAANQASDSSVCGLKEGDQISMRDLLYGLMMRSGNDAAIAIAEHISGSSEEFAVLMNAKAQSLGATNSHFVTPNGLHDEDHYTTVYDMYLIMNAAVQNETFVEILQTANYTTNYTDAAGNPVTQDWATTNKYLTGTEAVPEGVTVIGGKTGTTGEAKYCLVQYNQNASGEPMISIVFKADCRDNMYLLMSEILKNFSN